MKRPPKGPRIYVCLDAYLVEVPPTGSTLLTEALHLLEGFRYLLLSEPRLWSRDLRLVGCLPLAHVQDVPQLTNLHLVGPLGSHYAVSDLVQPHDESLTLGLRVRDRRMYGEPQMGHITPITLRMSRTAPTTPMPNNNMAPLPTASPLTVTSAIHAAR